MRPERMRIASYPHKDDIPDPAVREFIKKFYDISDNRDCDDLWVNCFTNDAYLTMGNKTVRGREEITKFRAEMWKQSSKRDHDVYQVYSGRFTKPWMKSHEKECQVMIRGCVRLWNDIGMPYLVQWAAHGKVVRGDDWKGWRFSEYRVLFEPPPEWVHRRHNDLCVCL